MISQIYDLIVSGGQCLISNPDRPQEITIQKCDIGIRNEKIVTIADKVTDTRAMHIDATGLFVMPGLIDSQVHFRDPGFPLKEDFASGTKAAVLGGITAVFDMPNTSPNTSTTERYMEKLKEVSAKAYCDFALYAGATTNNYQELAEMENLDGCCGIKIFMGSSTGDLLVAEDRYLADVLATGKKMVSVHCEDEAILLQRKHIADERATPLAHPDWRNVDSAFNATKRIVTLARAAGRRIHTLHITTQEELDFLKDNKDICTVEILPQHMYFSSPSCYEKLGTYAQMNPPIRDERHQQAIKKALRDGIVDVIASDHAPHTREEKAKPYPASPSGLTGVQTIVPVMLNFVNQGLLTLEDLARYMSVNPAKIFKAKGKGGIYVGQDADFTIVDLAKKQTVTNDWIVSACGWTPYDGETLHGWPTATVIRGQIVMEKNHISKKIGKPIRF